MPIASELSPAAKEEYYRAHRWGAAIRAGLLAGALLLLFPSGNPWTAFARPSAAHIMGRPISSDPSITILSAAAIPAHTAHLTVSVVYALILLIVVHHMRSWRAILAGILTSLLLYGVSFATFRAFAPEFTGEYEINVLIAHLLFGGVAAGAIRGFLRPPMLLDQTRPNPDRVTDTSRRSDSFKRKPDLESRGSPTLPD
jgi:uncharacterized membrane protein YagU involved in acid resistance